MNTAGSVLLDTNVVVAHLRNDPDLTARLKATPAVFVPWVVLGELHYGALRAQRREAQLALIRQQEDGSLQKIADQSQLRLPPLGAERAIVELAQDHPRHVNRKCGSQTRGETGIVSEVRDDHVGVQQDTTSRVHRSSRSLPR